VDKFVISGGRPLSGTIEVSGAKNAALPAMAASLLSSGPVSLSGVPKLRDVETMKVLLRTLGVAAEGDGAMTLDASKPSGGDAPYDLVRTMRASILVLGPLLGRLGKARVSLPGGCAIGTRPIDIHLKGMEALGADVGIREGYVEASAGRLKGARIALDFPSVTATENIMMAAALAEGTTVITNAAREPEISDLASCLNAIGGEVAGAGSGTITVEGRKSLKGGTHKLVPDRLEAGSWLLLSAMTGGKLAVAGARREHLESLEASLGRAGVAVEEKGGNLAVSVTQKLRAADIVTQPYPGFPTDMQAQWMALMCLAEGTTVVRETIFENRFQHVPELIRMGADISVKGTTAVVRGTGKLEGAQVMVSDLRAGIALVLAALAAEGKSEIRRIYHLDRGYERLEHKLSSVGADIKRVPQDA